MDIAIRLVETAVNATESAIVLSFLQRLLPPKPTCGRQKFWWFFFWCLAIIELSVINSLLPFEGVAALLLAAIYMGYILVTRRASVPFALFISIFTQTGVLGLAVLVNLLVCTVVGHSPMDIILEFTPMRLATIAVFLLFLFAITRLLLRLHQKHTISRMIDLLPYIILPLVAVGTLSIAMETALLHTEVRTDMLHLAYGIMLMLGISYFLFYSINRAHQMQTEYELLCQMYSNEHKQLERRNQYLQTSQKLRHDWKNHVLALRTLVQQQDSQEVLAYLDGLLLEQNEILARSIQTGNAVLDAILEAKRSACLNCGIDFDLVVMHGAPNFMAGEDISMLFGNLLDNAIEASVRCHAPCIRCRTERQGAYYSIYISNCVDDAVVRQNPTLRTGKRNTKEHGFGTRIIDEVVARYGGLVQFFERQGEFCCDILIEMGDSPA